MNNTGDFGGDDGNDGGVFVNTDEDEPVPLLVYDNTLGDIILQNDWSGALQRLCTSEGEKEANELVFENKDGQYWPIHFLYLTTSSSPSVGDNNDDESIDNNNDESIDNNNDESIDNNNDESIDEDLTKEIMEKVIVKLARMNPRPLVVPMPKCGELIVLAAMRDEVKPETIKALVDSNPESLLIRQGFNSNMVIHDLFKIRLGPQLLLSYLEIVITSKPECLFEKCEMGSSVISYALLASNDCPSVVELLFQHCPKLAFLSIYSEPSPSQAKDDLLTDLPKDLPLHYACHSCNCEVIDTVLRAFPDAVAMLDHQLSYPIHELCKNRHAYEGYVGVARQLIDGCPESLIEINRCGDLLIHILSQKIVMDRSYSEFKSSMFSSPIESITIKKQREHNKVQRLLLHHTFELMVACLKPKNFDGASLKLDVNTPFKKVAFMTHLFSPFDALYCELGSWNEISSWFKSCLIEVNISDETDEITMAYSMDPLIEGRNTFVHLLWNEFGKLEIVQKNWKAHTQQDRWWIKLLALMPAQNEYNDRLSLYQESFSNEEQDMPSVVKIVFDELMSNRDFSQTQRFQLVRTRNADGDIPLHRALGYGRSNEHTIADVKFLLVEHPEGAQVANANGELPLHIALKHQCPTKMYHFITPLFDAFPSSSMFPDPENCLMPFAMAALGQQIHGKETRVLSSCLPSTYILLRNNPSVLSRYVQGS